MPCARKKNRTHLNATSDKRPLINTSPILCVAIIAALHTATASRTRSPVPCQRECKENPFATLSSPSSTTPSSTSLRASGPPHRLHSTPLDHLATITTTAADRCKEKIGEEPAITGLLGPPAGSYRTPWWKRSRQQTIFTRRLWLLRARISLLHRTTAAGLLLGRSVSNIVTGTARVGLAAVDGDVR